VTLLLCYQVCVTSEDWLQERSFMLCGRMRLSIAEVWLLSVSKVQVLTLWGYFWRYERETWMSLTRELVRCLEGCLAEKGAGG